MDAYCVTTDELREEMEAIGIELVPWDNRCPECDEQRMDWLVWDGDNIPAPAFFAGFTVDIPDEMVTCQTCGHRYRPDGY